MPACWKISATDPGVGLLTGDMPKPNTGFPNLEGIAAMRLAASALISASAPERCDGGLIKRIPMEGRGAIASAISANVRGVRKSPAMSMGFRGVGAWAASTCCDR